jgi:hypothetical protein
MGFARKLAHWIFSNPRNISASSANTPISRAT